MSTHIAQIALIVKDYDEAIHFYTKILDFNLVEDTALSPSKRWVKVQPPGKGSFCLLLAQASNEEQLSRVGNQTGGRVFLFLYTDDFWKDFNAFTSRGVKFVREPVNEPYGTVAIFEDLYGNLWDMIEPVKK